MATYKTAERILALDQKTVYSICDQLYEHQATEYLRSDSINSEALVDDVLEAYTEEEVPSSKIQTLQAYVDSWIAQKENEVFGASY